MIALGVMPDPKKKTAKKAATFDPEKDAEDHIARMIALGIMKPKPTLSGSTSDSE
jgi:hypothetical protein